MRAKANLRVEDSMILDINLSMNVAEAKGLLKLLNGQHKWPVMNLVSILRQSLSKATEVFYSEHEIEP